MTWGGGVNRFTQVSNRHLRFTPVATDACPPQIRPYVPEAKRCLQDSKTQHRTSHRPPNPTMPVPRAMHPSAPRWYVTVFPGRGGVIF